MSFLIRKNLSFFFVFSKLNLSAYLSYCILSIEFYLKNYCNFYHNLSKSSFKFRGNAENQLVLSITPTVLQHCSTCCLIKIF